MSMTSGPLPRTRTTQNILVVLLSLTLAAFLVACDSDADEPDVTAPPAPTATTPAETPTGTSDASPTATSEPTQPPVEPTPGGNPDGEPTADDAVDVIEAYFAAIAGEDYEVAYALWRNEGEASGQTFAEFAAGYADTESMTWEIGVPGSIDPGAGQRYIEIPVVLTALTSGGESQRFEGTYVLHHTADIEGATSEQRVWRIHSATMEEAE